MRPVGNIRNVTLIIAGISKCGGIFTFAGRFLLSEAPQGVPQGQGKKPAAAAGADAPPAADTTPTPLGKTRARRTNKLSDSLKGLPTTVT